MFSHYKLAPLTALVLASSVVHAGFYAGVGIGSDTVDFSARSHVFKADPNQPMEFDVINKAHLSATGVFGTLFAGYGGIFRNQFYMAGEINGNLSSTESKGFNHEYVHLSFSDTSLKIKNSIGISVLPGYQFAPATLFYGRLGLTNSTISQQTSDISLANFSKRTNGFRYGLGIQQGVTDRLAVRMDYSRVDYKKVDTGTFDPVGNVTKTTRLTPVQQLVEFGLVFNFDYPVVSAPVTK